MTDITIKYDHGQMLIHLDNFLSDGKIAKVRKLLKLIRQSYTPECEEQIKEYLQCVTDKDKFHNNQVALAGKITNIESNIYILENRLKESKKLLTAVNREYKQNIKNRVFYQKVMQEFS